MKTPTPEEFIKKEDDGYIAGDYTSGEMCGFMQRYSDYILTQQKESKKESIKKAFEAGLDYRWIGGYETNENPRPHFEHWYKQQP